MNSSTPRNITPLEFSVPSLYDGIQLKGRLYMPPNTHSNTKSNQNLAVAIVAHPYAPLGGSFDDPVVGLMTETLLQAGVIVGTFNFRNASFLSKSGTSLTATPETWDYISFRYLLVHYLCRRFRNQCGRDPSGGAGGSSGTDGGSNDSEGRTMTTTTTTLQIRIIQGGYSYGSMIASRVMPWSDLDFASETLTEHGEKQPEEAQPSEIARQSRAAIRSIAGDLAKMQGSAQKLYPTAANEREQMETPSTNNNNSTPLNASDITNNVKIKTHYLLISPLLPPTTALLAPLASLPFFSSSSSSSRSQWRPSTPTPSPTHSHHQQHLADNPTLAIYGTDDVFASHAKLERWARDLAGREGSRFRGFGVEGAGHFWAGDGDEVCGKLDSVVGDWVRGVISGGGWVD